MENETAKPNPNGRRKVTPSPNLSMSTQKRFTMLPEIVTPPLFEEPEDEGSDEDDNGPLEMSTAAQAATLSAFLSITTSDSDDAPTETQTCITAVYHDAMDLVGIEDLVMGILKTGKLSIQGEPGDISKIQPALFALQANGKELPQLITQLIQSPFFYPEDQTLGNGFCSSVSTSAEQILQFGHVRLALPFDTAIYMLLRSFCAKTAKQAEAIINTMMNTQYTPTNLFTVNPYPAPPILFQATTANSQLHRLPEKKEDRESGVGCFASLQVPNSKVTNVGSCSSLSSEISEYSSTSNSTSSGSLFPSSSLDDETVIEERQSKSSLTETDKSDAMSQMSKRRTSRVLQRPRLSSSMSDYSDYETTINEECVMPDQSSWNTTIVENNMIVGQYGDTMHPLLMWNPKLTVDIHLKSSIGPVCGIVTGVDPTKPVVSLKVVNTTSSRIALSIRSHSLSTICTPRIVFPTNGLFVLEAGQSWDNNIEFLPSVKGKSDIFIIDMFVCTMGGKPSWNVIRRYAAMKATPSNSSSTLKLKRMSKQRRGSVYYLPGCKDLKEENIKVLISHGLQCVVKGKLDEAEMILTQALMLPDFQRIQLKAFVYICLGVVANKRHKKGHSESLLPVLHQVGAATQLVSVVESTPGSVVMPKMIQLVKQLKKELNIRKIFTDHRRKSEGKKSPKLDEPQQKESKYITKEGGTLFFNDTAVNFPAGAVDENTNITLTTQDVNQLDAMLSATGWGQTIRIITAVHISCDPIIETFKQPISVDVTLPMDIQVNTQCLRIVQSNYLRHWRDITSDTNSSIKIDGDKASITTDHSGWLALTMIHLDPSAFILKAMRSLSIEPVILFFNVYGLLYPDTRILQIAVFVSPKGSKEEKPPQHIPIAFPHSIQAYPGERLCLTFQGQIEPETSMNEKNLSYDFDVHQSHTSICEKWLRMTNPPSRPLSGKLVVSSHRNSSNGWESIAEILLLTKPESSSSSSNSDTNLKDSV